MAYLAIGAAAGVLAGLLGVGGGIVVVPGLVGVFAAQGVAAPHVLPLALGTSLATIVCTSLASLRAHHARAAVDWAIVQRLAPGLVVGALAGAWCAVRVSSPVLTLVFAGFLCVVATRLLIDAAPRPARELPGGGGLAVVGAAIGLVSGVVGIGGGTLSVPFLIRHRIPILRAIGTAAASGVPIASAGAIGYVVNGVGLVGLPSHSVGLVHLHALAGVAVASVVLAPLGARLAHRMPTARLKTVFAGFLYLVGAKLAWSVFHA